MIEASALMYYSEEMINQYLLYSDLTADTFILHWIEKRIVASPKTICYLAMLDSIAMVVRVKLCTTDEIKIKTLTATFLSRSYNKHLECNKSYFNAFLP